MIAENGPRDLDIKIANAKGYPVSWWSIHPWKDWEGHTSQTAGEAEVIACDHEEVLLPDDQGDMPMLQMLECGAWVMLRKWSSDWNACRALIEEMRALGLMVSMTCFQPRKYALPASCKILVWNEIREKWDKAEYFEGETIEECVAKCYLAYWEKVHGK